MDEQSLRVNINFNNLTIPELRPFNVGPRPFNVGITVFFRHDQAAVTTLKGGIGCNAVLKLIMTRGVRFFLMLDQTDARTFGNADVSSANVIQNVRLLAQVRWRGAALLGRRAAHCECVVSHWKNEQLR